MTTHFKLNGEILQLDKPFTSRNYNYPANWLRLTTLDEKKAIGIEEIEVTDAKPFDGRFYIDADTPRDLATLKSDYINQQKSTANQYLSKCDWYITRNMELSTPIPDKIKQYRIEVRDACTTREGQITTTSTVEALKTIIDGGKLVPWPEEVS